MKTNIENPKVNTSMAAVTGAASTAENTQEGDTTMTHQTVPNILSARDIKLVVSILNTGNTRIFFDTYQARTEKENPVFYTLRELVSEALPNSENLFKQYAVEPGKVKAVARSIFVDDMWLKVDVKVAVVDGVTYLYAGRHRLTAIVSVLAQVAQETGISFDTYLEQELRCEVLNLPTTDDLLELVLADNASRKMMKAESVHLKAQLRGADAVSSLSALEVAFHCDTSNTELKQLTAQYITRKHTPLLRTQTKQVLGEKLAGFILFECKPAGRRQPLTVNVQDIALLLDTAFEEALSLVGTGYNTARNIQVLTYSTIEALKVRLRQLLEEGGHFNDPDSLIPLLDVVQAQVMPYPTAEERALKTVAVLASVQVETQPVAVTEEEPPKPTRKRRTPPKA